MIEAIFQNFRHFILKNPRDFVVYSNLQECIRHAFLTNTVFFSFIIGWVIGGLCLLGFAFFKKGQMKLFAPCVILIFAAFVVEKSSEISLYINRESDGGSKTPFLSQLVHVLQNGSGNKSLTKGHDYVQRENSGNKSTSSHKQEIEFDTSKSKSDGKIQSKERETVSDVNDSNSNKGISSKEKETDADVPNSNNHERKSRIASKNSTNNQDSNIDGNESPEKTSFQGFYGSQESNKGFFDLMTAKSSLNFDEISEKESEFRKDTNSDDKSRLKQCDFVQENMSETLGNSNISDAKTDKLRISSEDSIDVGTNRHIGCDSDRGFLIKPNEGKNDFNKFEKNGSKRNSLISTELLSHSNVRSDLRKSNLIRSELDGKKSNLWFSYKGLNGDKKHPPYVHGSKVTEVFLDPKDADKARVHPTFDRTVLHKIAGSQLIKSKIKGGLNSSQIESGAQTKLDGSRPIKGKMLDGINALELNNKSLNRFYGSELTKKHSEISFLHLKTKNLPYWQVLSAKSNLLNKNKKSLQKKPINPYTIQDFSSENKNKDSETAQKILEFPPDNITGKPTINSLTDFSSLFGKLYKSSKQSKRSEIDLMNADIINSFNSFTEKEPINSTDIDLRVPKKPDSKVKPKNTQDSNKKMKDLPLSDKRAVDFIESSDSKKKGIETSQDSLNQASNEFQTNDTDRQRIYLGNNMDLEIANTSFFEEAYQKEVERKNLIKMHKIGDSAFKFLTSGGGSEIKKLSQKMKKNKSKQKKLRKKDNPPDPSSLNQKLGDVDEKIISLKGVSSLKNETKSTLSINDLANKPTISDNTSNSSKDRDLENTDGDREAANLNTSGSSKDRKKQNDPASTDTRTSNLNIYKKSNKASQDVSKMLSKCVKAMSDFSNIAKHAINNIKKQTDLPKTLKKESTAQEIKNDYELNTKSKESNLLAFNGFRIKRKYHHKKVGTWKIKLPKKLHIGLSFLINQNKNKTSLKEDKSIDTLNSDRTESEENEPDQKLLYINQISAVIEKGEVFNDKFRSIYDEYSEKYVNGSMLLRKLDIIFRLFIEKSKKIEKELNSIDIALPLLDFEMGELKKEFEKRFTIVNNYGVKTKSENHIPKKRHKKDKNTGNIVNLMLESDEEMNPSSRYSNKYSGDSDSDSVKLDNIKVNNYDYPLESNEDQLDGPSDVHIINSSNSLNGTKPRDSIDFMENNKNPFYGSSEARISSSKRKPSSYKVIEFNKTKNQEQSNLENSLANISAKEFLEQHKEAIEQKKRDKLNKKLATSNQKSDKSKYQKTKTTKKSTQNKIEENLGIPTSIEAIDADIDFQKNEEIEKASENSSTLNSNAETKKPFSYIIRRTMSKLKNVVHNLSHIQKNSQSKKSSSKFIGGFGYQKLKHSERNFSAFLKKNKKEAFSEIDSIESINRGFAQENDLQSDTKDEPGFQANQSESIIKNKQEPENIKYEQLGMSHSKSSIDKRKDSKNIIENLNSVDFISENDKISDPGHFSSIDNKEFSISENDSNKAQNNAKNKDKTNESPEETKKQQTTKSHKNTFQDLREKVTEFAKYSDFLENIISISIGQALFSIITIISILIPSNMTYFFRILLMILLCSMTILFLFGLFYSQELEHNCILKNSVACKNKTDLTLDELYSLLGIKDKERNIESIKTEMQHIFERFDSQKKLIKTHIVNFSNSHLNEKIELFYNVFDKMDFIKDDFDAIMKHGVDKSSYYRDIDEMRVLLDKIATVAQSNKTLELLDIEDQFAQTTWFFQEEKDHVSEKLYAFARDEQKEDLKIRSKKCKLSVEKMCKSSREIDFLLFWMGLMVPICSVLILI